jgi:hypothetical protein
MEIQITKHSQIMSIPKASLGKSRDHQIQWAELNNKSAFAMVTHGRASLFSNKLLNTNIINPLLKAKLI